MTARRPPPTLRLGDEPLWEGLADGVLRLQGCSRCDHVRYPPAPLCPVCLQDGGRWEPVSGRGQVVSWATFHRQYFPGMPPPYVVVAAQLTEGPIVVADLVEGSGEPALGRAVELVIEPAQFDDGIERPLFRWRLAAEATEGEEGR